MMGVMGEHPGDSEYHERNPRPFPDPRPESRSYRMSEPSSVLLPRPLPGMLSMVPGPMGHLTQPGG